MDRFDGFGPGTAKFLRGLGKSNTKTWFEAHRADYEADYLAPALAFIGAMGERLETFAPGVQAEPRVNGSLFRINRDVRFSKDKTPYKDHLDFIFWDGSDRKQAPSSFFLRIRATTVELGVGVHGFEKQALSRYRERVADAKDGPSLERIVSRLEKAGFEVGREQYKKLPRGYEPISGKRDRLLRHGALFASHVEKHPKELASKSFATWCARHWKKALPLREWLLAG